MISGTLARTCGWSAAAPARWTRPAGDPPCRRCPLPTPRRAPPVAAFPDAGEAFSHDTPERASESIASTPPLIGSPSPRRLDLSLPSFPSEVLNSPTELSESFSFPTTFPELPELTVAEYETFVLRNGLKVYLMEDHEVPIMYGSLLLRGGAQADPPDKSGLASVVAKVQRDGGTAALPGSALDLALEELGASVEVAAGLKTITINFSSLVEDASRTLDIVSQLIREPVLPQSELEKARASGLNSIAHRYDSASGVPRRKIQELLYGTESPLARQTTVSSLNGISRDDLLTFISTWQRPDTAVIGVVGDFDSADMKRLLESSLQEWTPRVGGPPTALPPLEDAAASGEAGARAAGRVYLVDKPGEQEAAVMMAEPGVALEDSDAPALDILGEIMNGFGGRLFDKVRSQEGLTYSVSGGWEEPPGYRGLFTVGGNTAKPAALVSAVREVLEELLRAPPSEGEIAQAKEAAANSFVFQFASRPQQLGRILVFDVLGLPPDYVQRYQAELEAVSAQDLLQATKRHLHPREQTVVVVGDARRLEAELESLPDFTLERLPLRPETDTPTL